MITKNEAKLKFFCAGEHEVTLHLALKQNKLQLTMFLLSHFLFLIT